MDASVAQVVPRHLPDEFVRPDRQSQGPPGSVLLWDVDPSDRREPIPFGP